MNATVTVTTVTQTANKELGTPEKTLYYLIIETQAGKHVINTGEKTIKAITELLKPTKGGK